MRRPLRDHRPRDQLPAQPHRPRGRAPHPTVSVSSFATYAPRPVLCGTLVCARNARTEPRPQCACMLPIVANVASQWSFSAISDKRAGKLRSGTNFTSWPTWHGRPRNGNNFIARGRLASPETAPTLIRCRLGLVGQETALTLLPAASWPARKRHQL